MDVIKSILDQFSGDNLDRLSSQLGTSPKATQTAAAAAVPTILSSLAGMAASHDGAKKLSSTLGGLDLGKLGSLAGMLGGNTNSVTQQGGNLLTSLFGDSVVSNIASAVGRYAGLDSGTSKSLLSYVMPFILGKLGTAWQSKGGTPSALQALFADQKVNIAEALPSGFSLASIPGLPSADAAIRSVGRAANATGAAVGDVSRRAAGAAEDARKSLLSWLLPLAALLLLALGLWQFFGRRPAAVPSAARKVADATANTANRVADTTTKAASETILALKPTIPDLPAVPDISVLTKDLGGIFTSANQALTGVRDAASAQAALPQLTELNTKIDGIRGYLDQLPAAGQLALGQLVGKQFEPIQEQTAKILAMPGVSDQVRSALDGITGKLAGLNLAQVSQNATSIFTTLTKTLSGFKDAAAAEAALPQLKEVSHQIDELKRVQSHMSPGGQSMLAKLVASARGSLDQVIAKFLSTLGVDAVAVKPMLDEIVNKLAGLTAPPG